MLTWAGECNNIYRRPSSTHTMDNHDKKCRGSAVFCRQTNPSEYSELSASYILKFLPNYILILCYTNHGDGTITLAGQYTESLSSGYGQGSYSKSTLYDGELAWKIQSKWTGPIRISTGIKGNKMPDLPANVQSNRFRQPELE
ncbi:hypothetical protein FQR65_LT18468 [Abscondita terminalis]|nr:hypothetical protein FQR65_LT18468 [Abscondita terminalis]